MSEVTRLFELLPYQKSKRPLDTAFAGKVNGKWVGYSTDEAIRLTNLVSYGLISLGLTKGDRVGIISNNRPEWNFTDLGTLQAGGIDVPVYPTVSEHDLKFILEDSEVKFLFVSTADLFQKVTVAASGLKSLKGIFTYDVVPGASHWSEVITSGEKNPVPDQVEAIKKQIIPADLATILYTSGTTGNPKGVMLSHQNLVSNFVSVRHLPPVQSGDLALSFLPLNHIYERMLTYLYMYLQLSIYYAESMETIGDNIREVKPHVFSAVPRLLEKVYDKIVAKGSELTGIKKKLFFWALELGLKYDPNKNMGSWYNLNLAIANKIIFNKWREALGGRVSAIVSGGAALQPRLARVFWSAGIRVLEGYGCTETSPVIAVNNLEPNGMRIGTVGTVIEGVQVKIAEDGEILCKGPNVMMGYYKHKELTDEAIDQDGWYHTGDIGILEENRFLKITDRKKEIFKTSGGKYIAPQMIENKLKESRFIEQAMVIGENQKFAAALIVPAFGFVRDWAQKKGLNITSQQEITSSEAVKERIMEEVELVNQTLGNYETIKKIALLPREFSIEGGEMTPKLSLKRKTIITNFKNQVEAIYVQ
jgi:long-chain acyl-CoA synthetase